MKKKLLIAAKILVSFGLIAWLLRRSDLESIWQTLAAADKAILLVTFLIFFVVYWLIAMRWRLLLAAQKVTATTGFLVLSFAISVFFNNFLPSTVGGDIYRMYDSWRLGARRSVAVSVVLIDRVIGLFALLLYALAASFFVPQLLEQIPELRPILLLSVAGLIVAGWMIFTPAGRRLEQLLQKEHPLLRFPLSLLEKITASFALFRGRHDVLLQSIGLSLLVQLTVIVHYLLIARALAIDVPYYAIFEIIPLSFLLMMLPVSINGIGIRETIFVFFLAAFGVSQEQAIAFAWASFGMILMQGVIGGVVFLIRKSDYLDIQDG